MTEKQDRVDDYLDKRDRIFNFLGSVASDYEEASEEHNILRLACHAILFCHSIEGHAAFLWFLANSPLSDVETAYYDSIGFAKPGD